VRYGSAKALVSAGAGPIKMAQCAGSGKIASLDFDRHPGVALHRIGL